MRHQATKIRQIHKKVGDFLASRMGKLRQINGHAIYSQMINLKVLSSPNQGHLGANGLHILDHAWGRLALVLVPLW